MELIFADTHYDTQGYIVGKYSSELLPSLTAYDDNARVTDDDIGYGADWPVVVASIFESVDWNSVFKISAIPAIFFLGKKINENIEAWLEIKDKLISLIKKIKPTRIDEKAALLIIIDDFVKSKQNLNGIEIVLKVHNYNSGFKLNQSLSKQSDSLYIFQIETDDKFYIYGIKSDTQIIILSLRDDMQR